MIASWISLLRRRSPFIWFHEKLYLGKEESLDLRIRSQIEQETSITPGLEQMLYMARMMPSVEDEGSKG